MTNRTLRSLLPVTMTVALAGCPMGTDDDDDTAVDTGEILDSGDVEDTGVDGDTGSTDTGRVDTDMAPQSIVDILTTTPRFSLLAEAVGTAGLATALSGNDLTVFAPNNTAFTALLTELGFTDLDDLSATQLEYVLRYHVLTQEVDSTSAIGIANGSDPTAVSLGGSLDLAVAGSDLTIDGATVIDPNIAATNGIIHEIDGVLLPSITDVVVSDDQFSSLEAAVGVVSLASTLDAANADHVDGEFTVFAPTDAAFGDLVTALSANTSTGISGLGDFTADQLGPVLRYHVLSGGVDAATALTLDGQSADTLGGRLDITVDNSGAAPVLSVDGAEVTTADILTSNGMIHVVDAVLLPSVRDLVSTHPDLGNLTAAASGVTGLVDALDDELETYTLLAPDDTAFGDLLGALPAEAGISGLADLTEAQLSPILNYHLIEGSTVYAADVPADADVTTAGGTVAAISGGQVTFDGQAVLGADLFASNGVVHLLEGVLLPDIVDIASTTPGLSSLTTAVGTAGLAGTLSGPGPFTVFAPDDAAFGALVGALPAAANIGGPDDLSAAQLGPILRYHVVDDAVYASEVVQLLEATTLGGTAALDTSGSVTIDGTGVTTTDILAANGVIHLVDSVLLPSITDIVTTDPELSSLAYAVDDADLGGTLELPTQLTLFAPTDEAFGTFAGQNFFPVAQDYIDSLPPATVEDLLSYHVYWGNLSPLYASTAIGAAPTTLTMFGGDGLGGTDLTASIVGSDLVLNAGVTGALDGTNDAAVITVDLLASNGVIHKIDAVLIPPATGP